MIAARKSHGRQKTLLSAAEAADRLGCTTAWIGKLVRLKRLDGFHFNGRALAITLESVEKNLVQYQKKLGKPGKGRPRKI